MSKHKRGQINRLHDFSCPLPDELCRFKSYGWATKALARERGKQHLAEHKDPTQTTPELKEFRAEHGVQADVTGVTLDTIDYDKLPSGVSSREGEES